MTKSELMAAAAPATNMTEFLTALAQPLTPAARAAMWARLGQCGIDTSHWSRSPHGSRKKYDDEDLKQAVANSISIAGVLRRLDIRPAGGSHFHISKRIRAAGLDTSHFLGRASTRGRHQPRKSAEEILVVLTPGSPRAKRHQLVRAMIECGVDYICSGCGIAPVWQGLPLTLAVDHQNGDWLDNRLNNLRFLCPNCHAQTSTWCRKKRSPNL